VSGYGVVLQRAGGELYSCTAMRVVNILCARARTNVCLCRAMRAGGDATRVCALKLYDFDAFARLERARAVPVPNDQSILLIQIQHRL
jgi:hypothetical protein